MHATIKDSFVAIADDLHLLAALHASEIDETMLGYLKETNFPQHLALDVAVESLSYPLFKNEPVSDGTLKELATQYSSLFLLSKKRVAAEESFFTSPDRSLREKPFYELRKLYREHQKRNVSDLADDHIALELEYMAHLSRQTVSLDGERFLSGIQTVHEFLTNHPLRWYPQFLDMVREFFSYPFYRTLVIVTNRYLESYRQLLECLLFETKPGHE